MKKTILLHFIDRMVNALEYLKEAYANLQRKSFLKANLETLVHELTWTQL